MRAQVSMEIMASIFLSMLVAMAIVYLLLAAEKAYGNYILEERNASYNAGSYTQEIENLCGCFTGRSLT